MNFDSANKPEKFGTSSVLEEQVLYKGRWSNLVEFSYKDDKNKIRKWEGLHRKHNAEAVIIIAKLVPSQRYVIIRQFRPPTDSYILEFPAGLVDPGETFDQTAVRELSEETGYIGEVQTVSPRLFSSPGILSEAVTFVYMQIDEKLPENQSPRPQNEPGEFITVFQKSIDEISDFFHQELKQGVKFDVKLYSYFMAQGIL